MPSKKINTRRKTSFSILIQTLKWYKTIWGTYEMRQEHIIRVAFAIIIITGTHFVLLHVALLCFADIAFFLKKLKLRSNPVSSKSIGIIFWQHLLTLCVSVSYFGYFHNSSNFLIMIIFVIVICDQWSLILLFNRSWVLWHSI